MQSLHPFTERTAILYKAEHTRNAARLDLHAKEAKREVEMEL